MTAKCFVDTNVIVYSRDHNKPEKQARAHDWLAQLWRTGAACISMQVLQEFYSVATRRLNPPMSRADARANAEDLLAWRPAPVTPAVLRDAWVIEDRFQLSWWDTLIVASARQQGCEYLLTEDLQRGLDIDGLTIIDPFATRPEEIL